MITCTSYYWSKVAAFADTAVEDNIARHSRTQLAHNFENTAVEWNIAVAFKVWFLEKETGLDSLHGDVVVVYSVVNFAVAVFGSTDVVIVAAVGKEQFVTIIFCFVVTGFVFVFID